MFGPPYNGGMAPILAIPPARSCDAHPAFCVGGFRIVTPDSPAEDGDDRLPGHSADIMSPMQGYRMGRWHSSMQSPTALLILPTEGPARWPAGLSGVALAKAI
jgi:hypothetical protein